MIHLANKTYKTTRPYTILCGQKTIYGKQSICYELGAVHARANAENFILPDTREKLLLNDFIRSEKKSGLFQKMDLVFIFGYNNIELSGFSRINLKKPEGNLATVYGGMSYIAGGWKGNGTDGYMGTGFNPAIGNNNYTINNACRLSVIYTSGGGAIDGINGTTHNRMFLNSSASHRINSTTGLTLGVSMSGTGLKMIAKNNSAESYFINKNVLTTLAQPSATVYNGEQILFKSGAANFSTACQSAYMAGAAINFQESQSLRANFNNLLTRLGLNANA